MAKKDHTDLLGKFTREESIQRTLYGLANTLMKYKFKVLIGPVCKT